MTAEQVPSAAVPSGDAGAEIAALVDAHLRDVPDFPIPKILFKDICPLLADGPAFTACVRALGALADGHGIDIVAGVEARGFVLAGALATHLGIGLVPVRKAGKLPPPTIAAEYTLEYGTAVIEVPVGVVEGKRVLLVDDVLATGGTLRAASGLIDMAGGTVVQIGVLLELAALGGRSLLGGPVPLTSLLTL